MYWYATPTARPLERKAYGSDKMPAPTTVFNKLAMPATSEEPADVGGDWVDRCLLSGSMVSSCKVDDMLVDITA